MKAKNMGKLLSGKVAVVASGTSDVGAGVVKALLSQDCQVIVLGQSNSEMLWLNNYVSGTLSGTLITELSDLSDYDKINDLTDQVEDKYGPIDIAVAPFDQHWIGPMLVDVEYTEWEKVLFKNLNEFFIFGKIMLQRMQNRRNGYFASIGDTGNLDSKPYSSLANITASAEMSMVRIFSAEVSASNVIYHHLFINNVAGREKSHSFAGKPNWITPEMIGLHLVEMYKNLAHNSQQLYHKLLGKASQLNEFNPNDSL